MRHLGLGLLLLVLAGGCQQNASLPERTAAEGDLFAPTAMRIHPIFTQVKDWAGDKDPDGVEALVEFQDQFGDPTKAAGTVLFELYEYRAAQPDPRGRRLALWTTTMTSLEEQRQRWNRTSRTYTFQLAYAQIRPNRPYVLTASFQSAAGGRFFDRIIVGPQPQEPKGANAATQPAERPATRTFEP